MFVRCSCSSRFLSTLSLRRATRGEIHANSQQEFLSTLSLRRATVTGSESQKLILHFYPRSPCGERLGAPVERMPSSSISIHALLAESDFNNGVALVPHQQISIHALLAESDPAPRRGISACHHISIHALLAESDFLSLSIV